VSADEDLYRLSDASKKSASRIQFGGGSTRKNMSGLSGSSAKRSSLFGSKSNLQKVERRGSDVFTPPSKAVSVSKLPSARSPTPEFSSSTSPHASPRSSESTEGGDEPEPPKSTLEVSACALFLPFGGADGAHNNRASW
jgi:hypothetical protein